MYVRSRAKPTNPNSEAQIAVRDAMREAVFAWSNTLTSTQRENWNTYAFNTPTWNRLGEATSKTGQQMFIRGAIPRIQAGFDMPLDAPVTFDLGNLTPPGAIVCDESAQTISVPFTNTDEWCNIDDGLLLVYQSRPQNPTRVYGKGPYQLFTAVVGIAMTPPVSPGTGTTIFPFSLGQKVFFKFNVSMPDGRLTMPTYATSIVTA